MPSKNTDSAKDVLISIFLTASAAFFLYLAVYEALITLENPSSIAMSFSFALFSSILAFKY